VVPGAAALDSPVRGPRGGWLLDHLQEGFTLLSFGGLPPGAAAVLDLQPIRCAVVCVDAPVDAPGASIDDAEGLAARRYDARPGTAYLLRPDQHVCARWRAFDVNAVRRAIARATSTVRESP
jgi:3-(3-hydroxy-phenyl)propionate hydroxylase